MTNCNENVCVLVGLDTSTTITGFSVYKNAVYSDSGVINYEKESDIVIRTENMCITIIEMLNRYKPQIVVIERPPFVKDPNTLINLSEIVGCVKGWALTVGYSEFVEYSPNKWRRLVADENESIPCKRNDCKKWDKIKAEEIIEREVIDDNEADAVLIGLARCVEMNNLVSLRTA